MAVTKEIAEREELERLKREFVAAAHGRPNPPNPKQRFGDMKVPLGLFPSSALIHGAQAFADGAEKYGPYNWRDKAVEAMTYIHAAERHLRAWLDREEDASDSGNHHLGHVLACVAIILDAQEQGNLIDNRPIAGAAAKVLARFERAKKHDDEVLTTTFGPTGRNSHPQCRDDEPTGCADDGVHPSHRHGRPGRREDGTPWPANGDAQPSSILRRDYMPPPVNGADALGLNKPPCYCLPDQCMYDTGHPPKHVYCKKAEDADRTAEPYAR